MARKGKKSAKREKSLDAIFHSRIVMGWVELLCPRLFSPPNPDVASKRAGRADALVEADVLKQRLNAELDHAEIHHPLGTHPTGPHPAGPRRREDRRSARRASRGE